MAKLAALLRIADALDREHRQRVNAIDVKTEGDRTTLRLRGDGDLLLEQWAVKKKGKLFERLFDQKLQVIVHGS